MVKLINDTICCINDLVWLLAFTQALYGVSPATDVWHTVEVSIYQEAWEFRWCVGQSLSQLLTPKNPHWKFSICWLMLLAEKEREESFCMHPTKFCSAGGKYSSFQDTGVRHWSTK